MLARVRSRRRTPWRRWVGIAPARARARGGRGRARAARTCVMTTEDRSSTIILLVDISGSMDAADVQPSRMDAAVAAMHDFLDRLPKNDKVGLVTFSDKVQVRNVPTTDRAVDRRRARHAQPGDGHRARRRRRGGGEARRPDTRARRHPPAAGEVRPGRGRARVRRRAEPRQAHARPRPARSRRTPASASSASRSGRSTARSRRARGSCGRSRSRPTRARCGCSRGSAAARRSTRRPREPEHHLPPPRLERRQAPRVEGHHRVVRARAPRSSSSAASWPSGPGAASLP